MAPTQGDAPPSICQGPNTRYGLVPEDELDYEESTEGSPSQARPLVSDSQRDYGFRPRDPAVVAREAAQQLLTTYVIGPEATTRDHVAARTQLREQYLTPQRTTPSEYAQRLSDQSNNLSVPDMRRIPVVFRPGELSREEDAQFQNWVEHSRKLSSLVALRASFSKQDHCDFRDWVAVQLSRFADDLEQAEHHFYMVAGQAS
ncbi:hypothetical protein PHPALM_20580 [Phytophthora palmivora]|uniref:Uncharacterized protein n=1 Tax=Phytophthora palmivora TaxID=4796 RepID=A0A2P4XEH8_9STRA|nr:hypothetical protein PHPALM_20580 [Phytophthora palmivora]